MAEGKARVEGICIYCEQHYPEGTPVKWAPTGRLEGYRFHAACLDAWLIDRKIISPDVLERSEAHRIEAYAVKGWDFRPRGAIDVTPAVPAVPAVPAAIPTPEFQPSWRPSYEITLDPLKDTAVAFGVPDPFKPAKASSKPASDNGITQAIIDAIWPTIEGHITSSVDMSQVEQFVESKLRDFTSPEPKSVTFQVVDLPAITVDTPHPNLPKLVWLLLHHFVPYLHNGAGSGKTHGAMQACKIVGCETTYLIPCNPFSSPIELTGYTNALGALVDKPLTLALRKAMQGEKVALILDEADSSRADFLPTLNGILSQKMLTLSNGETLTLPDTFYLILTGNTAMKGADRSYNGRVRQDASVQDRLWFMEWPYDEALEISICQAAGGTKGIQWAQYCQAIRHYVKSDSNVADVHVTLRAMLGGIEALCQTDSPFSAAEVADALIFKGCASDTRKRILDDNPLPKDLR